MQQDAFPSEDGSNINKATEGECHADLRYGVADIPYGMEYPQGDVIDDSAATLMSFDHQQVPRVSSAISDPVETIHGLELCTIDELVDTFHTMDKYFPFVCLPKEPASQLAQKRPFLLLAAITSASSTQPSIRASLDKQVKDTLSRRIVADGERSLDLLQGLLVYISW